MARRWNGNMRGERFCANANPTKREVHDLDREDTRPGACQIDEIIRAGHGRPYNSLDSAHRDGYDNCAYCIGGSWR